MFLTIDIGGTKTLVATFDKEGNIAQKIKFPTPKEYHQLIQKIKLEANQLKTNANSRFISVGAAVPVPIDYETNVALLKRKFGWEKADIAADLTRALEATVYVENDANLAALAEATIGSGKTFNKMLYLTISTGIGTGVTVDKKLEQCLRSSEGGFMYLCYKGKNQPWENFASGKAFTQRYGKLGSEVTDTSVWDEYAKTLAPGIINLILIIRPDVVVIGGGMGANLEKFKEPLLNEISSLDRALEVIKLPEILKASLPEDAVIYGAYLHAKSFAN